ncbi:MAG: L-histidine N(alpha)-methyltransferase [Alphaproteobacteria bacterium]|nr:L-histidine N(alpha)-methyltransferase [Alphaproteobacteria bacterium]
MNKSISPIVTKAAIDLFTRRQYGHAGEVAYLNGGGKLFGDFVKFNGDYYVYRGEVEHIDRNKHAIANDIRDTEHLIIVGQGPAHSLENKELQLIKLLPNLKAVTFIDISEDFNKQAVAVMDAYKRQSGRQFAVGTLTSDFHKAATQVDRGLKATVISTGSLISNVHNAPVHGFPDQIMIEMLQGFSDLAGPDGHVILGYDSNDDVISLSKAYNQQLAPFIKNIAKIIADHCEGMSGFDGNPDNFAYEMEWVQKGLQISHKLVVQKPQSFSINYEGRKVSINLNPGDEFVCISSLKPTPNKMSRLAPYAGLETQNSYVDKNGMVEHVFRVPSQQRLPAP